ncbi:hypothetical protein JCM6882_007778 [Rhodosporidiobolus microsporus]
MPLDTSPSPPPSYFDKIPLELIQLIVDFVREQDKVFHESWIKRAKPAVRCLPMWEQNGRLNEEWRQADKEARTVPLEGKWSCWLGRGMAALSLVNKELRGLTFVSLCETVTLKQLAKPFFLGSIAQRPDIVAAVRELDLRDETVDHYIAAAPSLSLLPVTRIVLDHRTDPLIYPDGFVEVTTSDLATPAVETFREFARTINSFEAQDLAVDQLECLFGILDLAALRKLNINYPSNWDKDPRARPYSYTVNPSWRRSFSFPSLQTLSISATDCPEPLHDFVATLAPNVRSFTAGRLDAYHQVDISSLASLRHLSLHALGAFNLVLPPASSLVTLTLDWSTYADDDVYESLPSPTDLPDSLRLVTLLLLHTTFPADDIARYRADCLQHGIQLRVAWTPDLWNLGPVLSEDGYDRPAHLLPYTWQESGVAAARDALDWARRTLDRAEEVEDHRTVHEVVQALMRVRERQAISLQ